MSVSFSDLIPNTSFSYQYNKYAPPPCVEESLLDFMPDISPIKEGNMMNYQFSLLNIVGWIPGVSSLSGLYRTVVAVAFLIRSIAGYIFDKENRDTHLLGMKIAGANIARGMIEIVPVVGNLFAFNLDISRIMHFWNETNKNGYGVNYYDDGKYTGAKQFPILSALDCIGTIPVVGTVVNAVRAIFFTAHILVNLPSALAETKYREAIGYGLYQVKNALIECIPFVACFNACPRAMFNDVYGDCCC